MNSPKAEPSWMRRYLLNPGLVVLGAGLLVLGVALWQVQSGRDFTASAERADGRVVELVRHRDGDTYAPRVQFTSATGEPITFLSDTGSSPPGYAVNERVEVLYQAEDPTDAIVNSFGARWGGSLFLAGFGTLLTLFGGLFYGVVAKPSPKRTQNAEGDSIQDPQVTDERYVVEPTSSGADDKDENRSDKRYLIEPKHFQPDDSED